MKAKCALYVDAGYLLASAATRVTGTSLRNGIYVDYPKLIDGLIRQAEEACGLPVLRVYWYDSANNGVPDAQQERIGELPKVKLRLGRFGVDGQQKGVDLRIGLDLVAHARNGTADAFYLVSGDDDLTEAVEEAQVHGVQVTVIAVPNADDKPHGVSRHLLRAADELTILVPRTVDDAVMKVEAPVAPPVPAPPPSPAKPAVPSPKDLADKAPHAPVSAAPPNSVLAYSSSTGSKSQVSPAYRDGSEFDEQIDAVVANVVDSIRKSASPDALTQLQRGKPSIPGEIDRALLLDLSDALGLYDLNEAVRFRLRRRFWELWEQI